MLRPRNCTDKLRSAIIVCLLVQGSTVTLPITPDELNSGSLLLKGKETVDDWLGDLANGTPLGRVVTVAFVGGSCCFGRCSRPKFHSSNLLKFPPALSTALPSIGDTSATSDVNTVSKLLTSSAPEILLCGCESVCEREEGERVRMRKGRQTAQCKLTWQARERRGGVVPLTSG